MSYRQIHTYYTLTGTYRQIHTYYTLTGTYRQIHTYYTLTGTYRQIHTYYTLTATYRQIYTHTHKHTHNFGVTQQWGYRHVDFFLFGKLMIGSDERQEEML